MTTPAPKLKASAIIGEVNDILRTATQYVDPQDPRIERMMRDVEAMRKINPAEAYSAMGSVHQLVGDIEQALYCINNSIQLAQSNFIYPMNKCTYLMNLGFFSEAQGVYAKVAKPEVGVFTHSWHFGYVCGAFDSMVRHLERAKTLKLDLPERETDTAIRAAKVFKKAGISDSEIGSVLDSMGTLLRERRLFPLGEVPRIRVYDGPDEDWFVESNYDVGVSPADAAAIYDKFVDDVVARDAKASQALSVSIRARETEIERTAA